MISTGTATLPLHPGKVPRWLYERMERIGLSITELLISEYGTEGFISRISNPFWFQALGCVMGMDWHSSGITTSVMGSLKRAINSHSRDFGLAVCGGRGSASRKTPEELRSLSSRFPIDSDALVRASRLSAKIDNSCIDDGYQLYLHSFIADREGNWAVIQQGMNPGQRTARRYHWHSQQIESFIDEPQSAIVGRNEGVIMNMTDHRSGGARDCSLSFIREHPDRQVKELAALGFPVKRNLQLELFMPERHEVRSTDVDAGRLGAVLAAAYDAGVNSFEDAVLFPGVGPRTIQALALVSEIVYGKPSRFSDPARFSFAHGGKDGHPFPVPTKVYDESIDILQKAVDRTRMGMNDKQDALKRLHRFTRELEDSCDPQADVEAVIAHEKRISSRYGGRTCSS